LEAGINAQFFALFTEDRFLSNAAAHTHGLIDLYESITISSNKLLPSVAASDVDKAMSQSRVASILAIEGGEAIGDSLEALRAFYDRGVRLMTLTWNRRNALARGVGVDGTDGLSPFGKQAVRLMNELGMIVDVSHLSDQAFYELLDVARKPIVASHSNARALCAHRRNLSDEQATLIAQSGGLIGITFAGCFIDTKPENVSIARLVEHIDHLVSVAGIDHVGIGSDFDGYTDDFGVAMRSCLDLTRLDQALSLKGYGADARGKIFGANWYRVIKAVCG